MATHRAPSIAVSILVLLLASVLAVSCDIQFAGGTAIQEVFEDDLVNDDVSLHPTGDTKVTIRLSLNDSISDTIDSYVVKFYRNGKEVKAVEILPIGDLSFIVTDLPRASYDVEAQALTHEGMAVAVGKASIQVTSSGAEATIELTVQIHVHNLVHADGQDASCTEDGFKEYWYCESCGKYFADANAENETNLEALAIPAKGHAYPENPNEVHEPTCVDEGYEVYICTVCSQEEKRKTADALGHEDSAYINDEYEHWKVCSRCKEEYDRGSHVFTDWIKGKDGIWRRHCEKCLIEETNNHITHIIVHHPYKDPSCEEDGNEEYWKCSVCGECFSNADGTDLIDKTSMVLPKKGHDFSVDWTTDETHHWHDCSRCSVKDSYKEHDFGIVYSFNAAERDLSIRSLCIVCDREESSSSQPSQTGAFDISVAVGIDVKRLSSNTWRISLIDSYSGYSNCTWTSNDGENLLKGPDPFTITVEANGDGRYMILCHLCDENGNEREICFVQISSNSK